LAIAWTIDMPFDAVPPGTNEEVDLIAASLAGEPDAFSKLVRTHQRRVFKLVGRFYSRPEDIEELAQETFLMAWRKLSTYKSRAPFEHWLTRVCLNCCYQRLRKQQPRTQLLEPALDVAAREQSPDTVIEVQRLLKSLAPRDRFILLLLDGEGWSVAEIASRLGWTAVNVKVRAHRARKKLRRLLEDGL
jgi:RNA polymerase sigma-70 factor (ECF subfamily)